MNTFSISGWVIDRSTAHGLSGLRVEGWDREGLCPDLVDCAITDHEGRFELSVSEEYLHELFGDRLPEIAFRVFQGQSLLSDAQAGVVWRPKGPAHVLRIVVDPNAPSTGGAEPAPFRVRGRIAHARTGPAPQSRAAAFDRKLAVSGVNELLLGEATTDARGLYQITYTVADSAPKLRPDLVLRVLDERGDVVAESPVLCRAPTTARLDLTIGGEAWAGASEYERLRARVDPLLTDAGLRLEELDDAGLTRLACSAGVDGRKLGQFHGATRLARDTSLHAELFFALASQGLRLNLALLLTHGPDALGAALERALAANVVSAVLEEPLKADIGLLLPAVLDAALAAPAQPGRLPIGAVLATGLQPVAAQRALLSLYQKRSGDGAAFWQDVTAHFNDPAVVNDLKLSVQLGLLAQGHIPLLQQLQPLRAQGTLKDLEALTDLSAEEWRNLLDAAGGEPAIPAHITGATPEERIERYLDGILRPLRTTFAGRILRRSLAAASGNGGPVHTGVVQLLSNLPDLDLRTSNIDAVLAETPELAFQGIPEEERPAVVRQVRGLQRLFRVTPHDGAVVSLLSAGFDSALSIARVPRARFVERFAGAFGGQAAARLAHAQARQHAACVQVAYLGASQAMNDPGPWAASGDAPEPQGIASLPTSPDLATLFGGLELCECKHCQSVYSPAAYFVDLLQFLDVDPGGGAARPLDVLSQRRPDLQRIALTCSNTNTPIPYIDLVNEVLESYVKARFVDGESPVTSLPAYDTGDATAADLRATPQHVEEAAYAQLAAQVYPPTLPFHRPLLVERTYLEHLGTTRLQVMETFRRGATPSPPLLVAEALGLSMTDYAILAEQDLTPPRLLREFYGYTADQVPAPGGGPDEPWQTNVARVPEFLRRAGIGYPELIALVKTWFVNRDQLDPAQRMLLESEGAECDLDRTRITHVTDLALRRMHRMLRLGRCLGLSMADVDRTLLALGITEIDQPALEKLAHAKRLSADLGRSIPELLPLWSSIDTWGSDSLYLRLFQDRATLAPEDIQAFALTYPAGDPDLKSDTQLPEIAAPGVLLGERDAVLLAAFRITSTDLARLCSHLGLAEGAPLTVATLSALYRHAHLARMLGLRVPDFLSLLELIAPGPLDPSYPLAPRSPAGTAGFMAKVRKVQHSAFKVADLDYLLRHRVEAGRSPAPTPDQVSNALAKIKDELAKIAADTTIPEDPTGDELELRLSRVFDREIVEQVMAVLLGRSEPRPAEPDTFIETHFSPFASAADLLKIAYTLELSDTQRQANLATVHQCLAPWLRDTLNRSVVVEQLAAMMALDVPLTARLLGEVLLGRVEANKPALADFLRLAVEDPGPGHAETYERLYKAARLIRGLGLGEREVVHLATHGASFAGFDFNELPPSTNAHPAGTWFTRWERLRDLARLRDEHGSGRTWLIDLFEREIPESEDPVQHLTAYLAELTGWDQNELAELTGASGFAFTAHDFRSELRLVPLGACITLMKKLGVSARTLLSWAGNEPAAEQAREVVQAVRARAGSSREQWLEVARTLNDRLREAQRSALCDFLVPRLADEGVKSADELFERFLIDTQMSACMATSRIKQAISSVQLFVQRCLIGLEQPAVRPEHIDADQWAWRKMYRVWEANRKVFLYPENWLEPGLRRDKSPFFKELETELLQQDLSDPAVEQALVHYLEKLDDVARLEICGMCWQKEAADSPAADDIDVLHVFGRTWNEPRVYYYRRLESRRVWTPWELVPLDIQSDHLIPVVHNRRLYLFWAIFTEKPYPPDPSSDGVPPLMRWEIKLAWSELRQGKWTPKRTSKGSDMTDAELGKAPSASRFTFTVKKNESSLLILEGTFEHDASIIYRFYQRGTAALAACNGEVAVTKFNYKNHWGIRLPYHATSVAMDLELDGTTELVIERSSLGKRRILESISTPARMHVPRELDDFKSPRLVPFFWQDAARTYFARPVDTRAHVTLEPGPVLQMPDLDVAWEEILIPGPIVMPGGLQTTAQARVLPGSSWGSILEMAPEAAQPLGTILTGNFVLDATVKTEQRLIFSAFEHPYVCAFTRALRRDGIAGLLKLQNQQLTRDTSDHGDNYFRWTYEPTEMVRDPLPTYDVDFTPEGAYSLYNWELFFHAPWHIADRLSQEQRHAEAQRWYHFIFDPTTDSPEDAPARFWKVRPLHDNTEYERAQDLLALLSYSGDDPALLARKQRVEDQVAEWAAHPFEPHRVARLRFSAYQKAIVMKYIDNLLAWGDQLFRLDTIESINEATQLYLLAKKILGRRPERVPARSQVTPKTYADLRSGAGLDAFSNALVELENIIFPFAVGNPTAAGETGADAILAAGQVLYFCTPPNSKLAEYWDIVDDRLFKIRNCMNIEGLARELPLFEPPIDPALLVRAAAAGLSLGQVLADLNAPLPFYRFGFLLQKALEMVGELRTLAAALLAALEKRDAEALASLRATHESGLLKALRRQRERQVDEAEVALEALQKTRKITEERHRFYRDIQHRSSHETEQIDRLEEAQKFQELANLTEVGVAIAAQIPNVTVGTSGMSPVATATFGGLNAVAALQSQARVLAWKSGHESYKANMASILGAWARRSEEWRREERLAQRELDQIDKQIAAAQIRLEIAKLELEAHERQIENALSVEEFLRDKFSNEELYGWMVTQTSAVYFQAYRLAYDLAKRAERAYRYERGLTSSDFIQPGYWEDLRRGLVAADRMALNLRRLESAYLEQNRREYELTRSISLADHDPLALLRLRETGKCGVTLDEWVFDLDHPGHYFRRLKTVSVTAPGVTGPYAGINGSLTLRRSTIRQKSALKNGAYVRDTAGEDDRFRDDYATQSIVLSTGQADSGLFELNLRDERLLPFEGAGADSAWEIEIPPDQNRIDGGLDDVVLHLRYTAREGGGQLREATRTALRGAPAPGSPLPDAQKRFRLISVKHDLPDEWKAFRQPVSAGAAARTLTLPITRRLFDRILGQRGVKVVHVALFTRWAEHLRPAEPTVGPRLHLDRASTTGIDMLINPAYGSLTTKGVDLEEHVLDPGEDGFTPWTLSAQRNDNPEDTPPAAFEGGLLRGDALENIWLVLTYTPATTAQGGTQ